MIKIEFNMVFDQIPAGTAQMKRYDGRHNRYFKSKKLEQTEATYLDAMREHAPERPIEGPVYLNVAFWYNTPDKKKKGRPKVSRPDCDNVAKLLIDCMTKLGFWEDDSQIYRLHITKHWAMADRAMISVRVLEEVIE